MVYIVSGLVVSLLANVGLKIYVCKLRKSLKHKSLHLRMANICGRTDID